VQLLYPATIDTDEGEFIVTCDDVPGVLAFGDTEAAALAEAREALGAMLLHMVANGEPIPTPSAHGTGPLVAPHARDAVKLALIAAVADAGISKSELAARLGRDEAIARRLLDPRHASRLELMEQALAALGHELLISSRAA